MSVILVPTDQSDGTSAIAAAAPSGDVIRFESAHSPFTGANNKNLDPGGKDIIFEGDTDDPTDTVIDCENSGRGFAFQNSETSDTIVRNLTVYDGNANHGGGIYISGASPTITNVIIDDCTATGTSAGGGIYGLNTSATISDSIISNNTAYSGGGIHFGGSSSGASGTNCVINSNTATSLGGGIVVTGCSPAFNNCAIYNNVCATLGGGIYVDGSSHPQFQNCTITENSQTNPMYAAGGAYTQSGSHITFTDCILWNNSAAGFGPDGWFQGSVTFNYCDCHDGEPEIFGTITRNFCIEQDPEFITGASGDYYLNSDADIGADSPCIDIGSDTAANLGVDDKTTRTDDVLDSGQVDLGYHYDQNYVAPTANFSASQSSAELRCKDNGITVQFTDTSTGDVTSWSWDFGDGDTSTEQNPSHVYESSGTYTVTLIVTGPAGSDSTTLTITITDEDRNTTTHFCMPYYDDGVLYHEG